MVDCIGFKEFTQKKFYVSLLAEFMGTLFLVFMACGSALAQGLFPTCGQNTVQIALGFGFSVATMVWVTARASGGHINPAVSFGFVITRKISWVRFLLYVVMQCLGAIVGAALLKAVVPGTDNSPLGTSTLNKNLGVDRITGATLGVDAGQGFGIELLITFVLVITVFSSVDGGRTDIGGSVPLTIGFSIAMCHLFAVPFTGAGMNPARVLGPAVVSGTWDDHWLYWVGPLIGGGLAALIYDLVFAVNASPAKLVGFCKPSYDDSKFDTVGKRSAVADHEPEEKF